MRYDKYNFIESYSNANGSVKGDSMLAKEIGAGVNANVYGKVTTQIIDQAIQLIIKNQKGN